MMKKMNLVGLFAVLAAAVVLSGCQTPLTLAVERGDAVEAQRLLNSGADINHRYGNFKSPLIVAAGKGDTEMVRLLLENGAEISGTDGGCRTAAELARQRGYFGIAELIEGTPQKRVEQTAKKAANEEKKTAVSQLKMLPLKNLLEKDSFESEPFVSALTDALVTAKVTQLPKFIVTASYEEKMAVQVDLEKRLLQSAVELQQCNNEAQGYLEQDNNQKTLELRNRSTALISYQTVLKAIKAELEEE